MKRESLAGLFAVFVLLGGAGMVVGADISPEITRAQAENARADADAEPYLDAFDEALDAVRDPVTTLAGAGREATERLQALDTDGMRTQIGKGNAALPRLESSLADLAVARDEAVAHVDTARVSAGTLARLENNVAAADSSQVVASSWRHLALRALLVGSLVDAIAQHDAYVFAATTAARSSQIDQALTLLDRAGASLTEAADYRQQVLATATPTPTLDNLLVRYAAFDAALTDLYKHVQAGGDRSTDEFATLTGTLARAQAALPAAGTILSLVVDEAAGSVIDSNLAAIETAASDFERARQ